MELLSTKKPDIPKKPEVKIEYNDRTYQSYIDTGFGHLLSPGSTSKVAHQVNSPRDRILAFLNEADIRKGPVERTVTHMYRLKAIDWNSPKQKGKNSFTMKSVGLLSTGWESLSKTLLTDI